MNDQVTEIHAYKKIDYMAGQMIFVNLDDGVKNMRYLRMSWQRLNKG